MSKTPGVEQIAPLADAVEKALATVSVTTHPVVICGVNRKVYIGNFETVDVYAGVALPLGEVDASDFAALRQALEEMATFGFEITSKEAGDRYRLIKDLQAGS